MLHFTEITFRKFLGFCSAVGELSALWYGTVSVSVWFPMIWGSRVVCLQMSSLQLGISTFENESIALSQNIRNQIFSDPALYPRSKGNSSYILNII
jgi:hypothetical protein